jgi:uncharacterized protein YukE
MAMVGMDVNDVRNIGNQLKHQAGEIQNVIAQVDTLIANALTSWQGHDATQFQDWWNSQHKPALTHAQQAIDGLGQSALNNAAEQENVSNH